MSISVLIILPECTDTDEPKTKAQSVQYPERNAGKPVSETANQVVSTPANTSSMAAPEQPHVIEELPNESRIAATIAEDTDTDGTAVAAAPEQHIVKGVVTQWNPMTSFVKSGD